MTVISALINRGFLAVLLSALLFSCVTTQQPITPIVYSTAIPANQIQEVDGRWLSSYQEAPLAAMSADGQHLVYGLYANNLQGNRDHILPDFSYAGYKKGGVALPSYSSLVVKERLSPLPGDNWSQIQAAIDRVSVLPLDENGLRGVVLLTAGSYEVTKPLIISASGVILRGEGQGEGGTLLKATSTKFRDRLIQIKGKGNGLKPQPAAVKAQTEITSKLVAVGSRRVEVASVKGYAVGDEIAIVRTPNALWVSEKGINTAQFGWQEEKYEIPYERKIIAIEGNSLVLDIPMVESIQSQFGGGYVYRIDLSGRIQQAAVENMQLQTRYYRFAVTDENRAFFAIDLREVENSWVRDVTIKYFSHAYNLRYGARFNTLQDVAFVDPNFAVVGGRHYGFNFDGGSFNLFQRCYARKARHSFVSGSRVTGPNVFLDCVAVDSDNDSGPHHRWATGTLFDNTKGYQLRVQNRQDSGSGHGWAGAQQLFWNSEHQEYVLQAPPYAMNWAVGIKGDIVSGQWTNSEAIGMLQSKGQHVPVRSLYLQQLQDRLGEQAVQAVTIEAQRQGVIWPLLINWSGEKQLTAD